MTLCNWSLRFSSKVAIISVEPRETVHDVGKIKRVKPEEPRSQECVRRAALGSLRWWASGTSVIPRKSESLKTLTRRRLLDQYPTMALS